MCWGVATSLPATKCAQQAQREPEFKAREVWDLSALCSGSTALRGICTGGCAGDTAATPARIFALYKREKSDENSWGGAGVTGTHQGVTGTAGAPEHHCGCRRREQEAVPDHGQGGRSSDSAGRAPEERTPGLRSCLSRGRGSDPALGPALGQTGSLNSPSRLSLPARGAWGGQGPAAAQINIYINI